MNPAEFAAALDSGLADLQAYAEARMSDTFDVFAPEWVKVDGLDEVDRVWQFQTVGRVTGGSRDADTETRTVTVGGVERAVVVGGLHVPAGERLPESGWEFECVAVGNPANDFRVGRRWHVVNVPLDDATARRLDVVELPPLEEE